METPTQHPSILPIMTAILCLALLSAYAINRGYEPIVMESTIVLIAGLAGYNVSKAHKS